MALVTGGCPVCGDGDAGLLGSPMASVAAGLNLTARGTTQDHRSPKRIDYDHSCGLGRSRSAVPSTGFSSRVLVD